MQWTTLSSLTLHVSLTKHICYLIFACTGDVDILNGTSTAIRNVGWGKSFKCNRNVKYDLTSEESGGTASIIFNQIQIQVFNFSTPGQFSEGSDTC